MTMLRGEELLIACRTGRGTIVMVEGETQEDDPFFYGCWFGDRAREISFFAQNGWLEVCTSVAHLRSELPWKRVFGIVDRDHAPEEVLLAQARQLPSDGILRTRCFTLEPPPDLAQLVEQILAHRAA